MSDQPENVTDDLGSYSVDDEDQLQPEDTLDGSGDDVLEDGYSPPDRLHGSLAHGVTAEEQHQGETLEARIHQEVPEEGTAYGAPDDESGLDAERDRVGGDDPDAIDPQDDWLGDGEVGGDEGGTGGSAEEAAMHVVDEEFTQE